MIIKNILHNLSISQTMRLSRRCIGGHKEVLTFPISRRSRLFDLFDQQYHDKQYLDNVKIPSKISIREKKEQLLFR